MVLILVEKCGKISEPLYSNRRSSSIQFGMLAETPTKIQDFLLKLTREFNLAYIQKHLWWFHQILFYGSPPDFSVRILPVTLPDFLFPKFPSQIPPKLLSKFLRRLLDKLPWEFFHEFLRRCIEEFFWEFNKAFMSNYRKYGFLDRFLQEILLGFIRVFQKEYF